MLIQAKGQAHQTHLCDFLSSLLQKKHTSALSLNKKLSK